MNGMQMASAMQNMILGTPSAPDPFQSTGGVSTLVEYGGCIDGGIPNLKACVFFAFSFSTDNKYTHIYTTGIRHYNQCAK